MKRVILMIVAGGVTGLSASADSYTTSSSFSAAISGMSNQTTANFDSDPLGALAQGATVDGITFNSVIAGGTGSLSILNDFDTTSPHNFLGSNDPTTLALFTGDSITMSFASPVNAVGLYIIFALGPFSSDDFTLASGPANGSNSGTLETPLADGGQVLFLGITSDTAFSSAKISLDSNNGELWDVDDITTAQGALAPTPEPATLALVGGALFFCALRFRRLHTLKHKTSC